MITDGDSHVGTKLTLPERPWTTTVIEAWEAIRTMRPNSNDPIKFDCASTVKCPNWHFKDTSDPDFACKPCRTCDDGETDILESLRKTGYSYCTKEPFQCVTSKTTNRAARGCVFKVLPGTQVQCSCGKNVENSAGDRIGDLNLGSSCNVTCPGRNGPRHKIECKWITERNSAELISKKNESCGWEVFRKEYITTSSPGPKITTGEPGVLTARASAKPFVFPKEDTTTSSPGPEITTGEPGVMPASAISLVVGCSVAAAVVLVVILLICLIYRLRKPWCQQFMGCRSKLTEVCLNQRGNPTGGPDGVNQDPVTTNLIRPIDQPSARIENETQGQGVPLPDLSIFNSSHRYSEDKSTTEHGNMIDTPKEEDTYLLNDVTDPKQTEPKEARHVPTESSPVETTYHSRNAAPEGHTNNFTSAQEVHRLNIRLNSRTDRPTPGSEYLDTSASSKDTTYILPSLATVPTRCSMELTTYRHDDGAEQGYDTNSSTDSNSSPYSSRPHPEGQTLSLQPLLPPGSDSGYASGTPALALSIKGKAQPPRSHRAPVEHGEDALAYQVHA